MHERLCSNEKGMWSVQTWMQKKLDEWGKNKTNGFYLLHLLFKCFICRVQKTFCSQVSREAHCHAAITTFLFNKLVVNEKTEIFFFGNYTFFSEKFTWIFLKSVSSIFANGFFITFSTHLHSHFCTRKSILCDKLRFNCSIILKSVHLLFPEAIHK